MALEESIEGLEKIESNGITAWLDAKLKGMLDQLGKLSIDYTRDAGGKGGYLLTTGDGDCSGGCSSC